jgi:hypothetical protein
MTHCACDPSRCVRKRPKGRKTQEELVKTVDRFGFDQQISISKDGTIATLLSFIALSSSNGQMRYGDGDESSLTGAWLLPSSSSLSSMIYSVSGRVFAALQEDDSMLLQETALYHCWYIGSIRTKWPRLAVAGYRGNGERRGGGRTRRRLVTTTISPVDRLGRCHCLAHRLPFVVARTPTVGLAHAESW